MKDVIFNFDLCQIETEVSGEETQINLIGYRGRHKMYDQQRYKIIIKIDVWFVKYIIKELIRTLKSRITKAKQDLNEVLNESN